MAKTAVDLVTEARVGLESISPQAAQAEVASGKAVLLDVREPVEWTEYIGGAVQVPRGLLEFAADPTSPRHKLELEPARRMIVYCRSGVRAALAASTLKTLGYADVANLDGGISAWKAAGLPILDQHEGL